MSGRAAEAAGAPTRGAARLAAVTRVTASTVVRFIIGQSCPGITELTRG